AAHELHAVVTARASRSLARAGDDHVSATRSHQRSRAIHHDPDVVVPVGDAALALEGDTAAAAGRDRAAGLDVDAVVVALRVGAARALDGDLGAAAGRDRAAGIAGRADLNAIIRLAHSTPQAGSCDLNLAAAGSQLRAGADDQHADAVPGAGDPMDIDR